VTRRRLTLALTALLCFAAAPARAEGPPAPVPIDSGWELSFDHATWRPTTVPGVFDTNTPPDEYLGRVGWYRVTFTGPQAPAGYDWALRFESVRRTADVTLNGEPIGRHTDPYLPFELPASGIKPGEPNVLEVRVDNRKIENPREGWWNWGGIVRPVELVAKGRVALDDAAVLTRSLSGRRATMLFDGWVTNRSDHPLSPEITVALHAPSGRTTEVRRHAGELAAGEQRRVRFAFAVDHAETWAPDHPALYGERIDTTADGRLEQRDTRQIGIRSVRVVGGRLELNGEPVELRGASIQEDLAGRGPALTDADMDWIVARLKELHANVTRAHYLLNDRLLDRLDRAGIMVWSQSPIYHRDSILVTPQQRADALATVRGTVLSARRHPSVFTHSVANELSPAPDRHEAVRQYVDAARRLELDLDPTIPPSIDTLSYPGFPRATTYAQFPLLGINSYFGWYHGKQNHPVGDINGLGPYLQRMQRLYPDSAKIVTEFGAEATMDGPADQKQTYAFQAAYVKKVLSIVEDAPNISGAIYWTLREFAVKPFWDGGAELRSIQTDSIHNKGLISYDGKTVKPAFAVAQKEFAATPLYPGAAPAEQAAEARPADPLGWALALLVPLSIIGMLLAALWALRDIWRFTRPPEAAVVALPRRRAA
jgi:beta-glucuronidase